MCTHEYVDLALEELKGLVSEYGKQVKFLGLSVEDDINPPDDLQACFISTWNSLYGDLISLSDRIFYLNDALQQAIFGKSLVRECGEEKESKDGLEMRKNALHRLITAIDEVQLLQGNLGFPYSDQTSEDGDFDIGVNFGDFWACLPEILSCSQLRLRVSVAGIFESLHESRRGAQMGTSVEIKGEK